MNCNGVNAKKDKEKKAKNNGKRKFEPKTRPADPLPTPPVREKMVKTGPRPPIRTPENRPTPLKRPLRPTPVKKVIIKKTKAPTPALKATKAPVKAKDEGDQPTPGSPSPNSPTPPQTCRMCRTTFRVPRPRLILLDKKCSEWNRQEYSNPDCRNIQATIGAACQCEAPPRPRCNVCEDGDYIWEHNPNYNTFTDDFCVKMIYKMSQRYEFCVGNREHVARMCCMKHIKDDEEKSSDEKKKYKSRKDKYKDVKSPTGSGPDAGRSYKKSNDVEMSKPAPKPTKPPTKSPTYYPTYYYYFPTESPTKSPTKYPTPAPVEETEFYYYYYDDYYVGYYNDDNIGR